MKTNRFNILIASTLLVILTMSCKKNNSKVEEPPAVTDSPELLTSMILQFRDSANVNNLITTEFRDPDGPGGKNPTKFDTIQLATNKTYLLKIILLDETKNPIDTVSKSVWEKRNEHQIFFSQSNVNLVTQYLDIDGNGLPVGLSSKWKTGASITGSSKITLKHQPNLKNGSITSGETDIELSFQTHIK